MAFDPDQPRDEHGRWEGGGSSGSENEDINRDMSVAGNIEQPTNDIDELFGMAREGEAGFKNDIKSLRSATCLASSATLLRNRSTRRCLSTRASAQRLPRSWTVTFAR
jgi:hypothetical protein